MRKEKSAGCVILNENKVLLILQKNGDFWGFPKGHLEENETEIEAAKREVLEETGIEVIIDENKRYETNYIIRNEIDKTSVFYVAKPKSGTLKKQECEVEDIGWFGYEEALEKLSFDNYKEVLKKALQANR